MKRKFKVVIYLRTNSRERKQLEIQEQLLLDYCKNKNYEVVEIYKDFGVSDNELFKPELELMLEDLQDNGIGIVVMKSLDRLSRYIEPIIDYVKYIDENCCSNIETIDGKVYCGVENLFGGEREWNKLIKKLLPSTQEYQL